MLSASVLTRLSGLGGAARTVRHQYERWDGSGGPHGMRGPDIPLAARLLALAATLVGHPSPGAAANWTARQRRVDELLGTAEHARRALQASTVTIGRLDHETAEYETLLNVGDLSGSKERFPAKERHGVGDQPGLDGIFEGHGFVRATDDGRADDSGIVSLYQRGLCPEALWPINIGDSLWGLVIATTRAESNILDHDDLDTLRLVATHIAAAVSQAQRIAEFEELALRDPLTGLGNRRVLDERLQDVFSRPPVDRQDVAVVMCDVDGLKIVNNDEGHAAGDSLLVDAARSLADAADTVENSKVCGSAVTSSVSSSTAAGCCPLTRSQTLPSNSSRRQATIGRCRAASPWPPPTF